MDEVRDHLAYIFRWMVKTGMSQCCEIIAVGNRYSMVSKNNIKCLHFKFEGISNVRSGTTKVVNGIEQRYIKKL